MTRVCLGDAAREIKQKAPAGQKLPTVGLEHLDPGEIELVRWDEDAETTFTKAFSKGQVLFGRRRAYLRKAAVAPFDGVCSGDITVIAAKSNLSPRLLPFIIQNDALFEHAVTNSAGSLSPRVKWQSLSQFEFELPSIDKQEELADILWAAQETRSHYRQLLTTCDDVVKSQFVEMFGDPCDPDSSKFPGLLLKDICDLRIGPFGSALHKGDYITGGHPLVNPSHIISGCIEVDSSLTVGEEKYASMEPYHLRKGDVVLGRRGEIGRCAVVDVEGLLCGTGSMILRPHTNMCLSDYLQRVVSFPSFSTSLERQAVGVTMKNLNAKIVGNAMVVLPPLALQREFADFAVSVDKSKFAVQKALDELNATTKKILNQELGLGDV